jgi:hypothetical protein
VRRAGLLLLCLLLPSLALAQSPREVREAERTAQDRRQAAEAAARDVQRRAEEEVRLAGQRVEAAQRAQAAEAELTAARTRAEAARDAAAASAAAFRARNEAFRPLLPVMMRLSLWPAETVLAVPAEPEEALRGALVLRGLVRRLEEEAAGLREAGAAAEAALALAEREQAALAAADQRTRQATATVEAELAAARARRAAAEAAEDRAADRAQAAAILQEALDRFPDAPDASALHKRLVRLALLPILANQLLKTKTLTG